MRFPGEPIGDRAGEPRYLERGRYDAWIHVVIAFIYAGLLIAASLGLLAAAGVGVLVDAVAPQHHATAMYVTAGVVGLAGAWLIFRDRWRCIEAVASRYCSGLANLSMIYVPVLALFYALYRGIGKLRGN
jgi:hypothetical protein